jgi:hypothetical protein
MNTTSLLAGVSVVAGLYFAAPHHAHAGERLSIEQFQSRHAWQVNYENLIQRGINAGADWKCHGDNLCNMYFLVKPGVKAHLSTARYGNGYCYILEGAPTADCYRDDGKKTVWTVDKPFEYGLTPDYPAPQSPAPDVASAPTAPAAIAPAAPASVAPSSDAIPMNCSTGSCYLKVDVGDSNIPDMVLDTGATSMSVTRNWATALVAEGAATWGNQMMVTLAGGSQHMEDTITIKRVSVGNRTTHNVHAVVTESGDMLFGLIPLNDMGVPIIDARNGWLHFAS